MEGFRFMNPRPDDQRAIQSQLAAKDDLIAALTAQLEKTVNQLDRLRRSGADRPGFAVPDGAGSPQAEMSRRLISALDEWTEFEPARRVLRIEEGIERILDLLENPPARTASEPPEKKESEDFWASAKARLLGENPPAEPERQAAPAVGTPAGTVAQAPAGEPADLVIPTAPEAPVPIAEDADAAALLSAVETRDKYIQYLTARLRVAESEKFVPVNWELLDNAPDDFRDRLESLETLLKDQLKQAEIAIALERAVLTRERAKLSQIKQSLETQIKRMGGAAAAAGKNENEDEAPKSEQERRWKRIFTR